MIKKIVGWKTSRLSGSQVVLCLSGLALLFAIPAFAGDTFMMNANGTVQAGEQTFASFEEYAQSDYFRENGKRCGTKAPSAADDDLAKSVNDCTMSLTNIQNEYWPSTTYVAKIWFHVIYQSNGTGNVTDAAIQDQVKVLNEDYRATTGTMGSQGFDTNIQFELAGITRTQNDAWFTDSAADEAAYKQALNKDPSKFINVYTNDASGYLGYAYFPQGGTAGQYYDGIVMNYLTIGGRNNTYPGAYNQGRTLVHEMGHYMGLYHTFQDGATCINSYTGGDLILDTPAESEAHYSCVQTNTCNSADPIHNYMDYTDDICMYQFTQEQGNRAVCGLVNYRPGIYSTNVPPPTPGGSLSLVAPIIKPLLLQPSCENTTTVLTEDFETNPTIRGWSIVNNGGDCTWNNNAYYGVSNKTGGSGYSAAADSDVCGFGTTMDTELRTPPLDLSSAGCATLTYKTFYEDWSGDADGAYVDISTDGGSSWTNILQWVEVDHAAAETVTLDLTPHVGSANTLIRFHYIAPDWDWDWQVDEVVITTD